MPKKIDPTDIINKRFNNFIVISVEGKDKHGHYKYTCKCDCGNIFITDRRGVFRNKSCGCIDKLDPEDIIDKRFGRLIVKSIDGFYNHHYKYFCKCDCGNITSVERKSLLSGETKSCGCYSIELRTKHGMTKTRFYKIWINMKNRCNDPNSTEYYLYGGRGISVDNSWENFINFKNDMYDSYIDHCNKFGESETTIDRIDPNKNYCKDNCKWSTRREQNINRSNVISIKYNNEILPLPIIYDRFGDKNMEYSVLYHRIVQQKMNITDALYIPVLGHNYGDNDNNCPIRFIKR